MSATRNVELLEAELEDAKAENARLRVEVAAHKMIAIQLQDAVIQLRSPSEIRREGDRRRHVAHRRRRQFLAPATEGFVTCSE